MEVCKITVAVRRKLLTARENNKSTGRGRLCPSPCIKYSKSADALYIRLRKAKIVDSMDIEEGVTVDMDENNHIVGLEILDASERLEISDLVNISIENLPLEKVT